MPFNFIHQVFCRLLVPHNIVTCSEEVLERQFMPPHTGSDKIATIYGEHFQLVLGSVHIMDSKIQLAISELISNPVFNLIVGFATRFDSLLVKLHWVLFIDLRKERQPTHPNGKSVHVGRVVKGG